MVKGQIPKDQPQQPEKPVVHYDYPLELEHMTPNINLLKSTPKGMELRDHFGLPKRLNM